MSFVNEAIKISKIQTLDQQHQYDIAWKECEDFVLNLVDQGTNFQKLVGVGIIGRGVFLRAFSENKSPKECKSEALAEIIGNIKKN